MAATNRKRKGGPGQQGESKKRAKVDREPAAETATDATNDQKPAAPPAAESKKDDVLSKPAKREPENSKKLHRKPKEAEKSNEVATVEPPLQKPATPKPSTQKPLIPTGASAQKGEQKAQKAKQKAQKAKHLARQKTQQSAQQKGQKAQQKTQHKPATPKPPKWQISHTIGGRILNIDPVFSRDDLFFIVAHQNSLHVYSTETSLLVRSISLEDNKTLRPHGARVVAYSISPSDPKKLWVACSDGAVFNIDWTTGTGTHDFWNVSSVGLACMTVALMESQGRKRDVVFTTERAKDNAWRITAHELNPPDSKIPNASKTIHRSATPIQLLQSVDDGQVIVAASKNSIAVGSLKSPDFGTVNHIVFEFRVFEASKYITCLDVQRPVVSGSTSTKVSDIDRLEVVDLVVGDAEGQIFIYNDILRNLALAEADPKQSSAILRARKIHWHRNAVQSVKWSLDGNYVISGGNETVLVLWQLDTGRQQLLPHLSAAIKNIVVSQKGVSYGIHLDDNSVMVISTAELKPIANVSGLQIPVIQPASPFEPVLPRGPGENRRDVCAPRVPVTVNVNESSRLLMAVGEVQEIEPTSTSILATPYLQSFDIATGQQTSKQALTRTNVTNKNITPDKSRVSEPLTTHIQTSHDGSWLATVDFWEPPTRDFKQMPIFTFESEEERRRRREVHLKFWQRNSENNWELVSRIDAPHTVGDDSSCAGRVLALAADPASQRFATIGEDKSVKIWSPRTRRRDNVVIRGEDGQPLRHWNCIDEIPMGKLDDEVVAEETLHGCLSFSDDSSLIAAALADTEGGQVALIDTRSGTIRQTLTGVYNGDIIALALAGPYLVTLADELRVFDLVEDALVYGVQFQPGVASLSFDQRMEMFHLAVDRENKVMALALPSRKAWMSDTPFELESLEGVCSEVTVYKLDSPEPLTIYYVPCAVSAVLPAVAGPNHTHGQSPGFIILDTSAHITTVAPKATKMVLAKSTVDLGLDNENEQAGSTALIIHDESDEEEGEDMADETMLDASALTGANGAADDDDDDDGLPVVSKEQLNNLFDVGPAFASLSLEDMFYRVVDLVAPKPLAVEVS